MNETIKAVPVTDLPLAAYCIARYAAVLMGSDVTELPQGRRVRFFLDLKDTPLPKIKNDFDADGHVNGRQYSQEMRRLRGIVLEALRAFERQERAL